MNTVLVGTGGNSKFLNKVFYDLYTKLKAILQQREYRTLLQLRIGVPFFENFYFVQFGPLEHKLAPKLHMFLGGRIELKAAPFILKQHRSHTEILQIS